MGACTMGPPTDLVLALAREHGITTFVEAGTYAGDTAAWAAGHFSRVVTIEAAAIFAERARTRFAGTIVEVREGTSTDHLARLVSELRAPVLFWLDAHWSGGETAGREDECPLLRELALFDAAVVDHVILIDDARLFAAPPPRPHDAAQWPDLAETVTTLHAGGRRFVMLVDDVLVGVPMASRSFLIAYWQDELARRATRPAWVRRLADQVEKLGRRLERPVAAGRS